MAGWMAGGAALEVCLCVNGGVVAFIQIETE